MNLGKRVKELRKKRGLTQQDLARQSGVSYSFINQVEGGKKSVRLDRLNKLLGSFGYEIGVIKSPSEKSE